MTTFGQNPNYYSPISGGITPEPVQAEAAPLANERFLPAIPAPIQAPINPYQTAAGVTSAAANVAQVATNAANAGKTSMGVLKTLFQPGTLTGIGAVGSLLLSAYGMYVQNKETKAANARQDFWLGVQNALAKQENERQWKWKEEERDYSRQNDFLNKMMGWVNADAQLKANLTQIWPRVRG